MINLSSTIITDLDMELKMKLSTIKYLESKHSYNCKYTVV